MSADPFDGYPTRPISIHNYLYADANPANMTDPSGFESATAAEQLVTVAMVSVLATNAITSGRPWARSKDLIAVVATVFRDYDFLRGAERADLSPRHGHAFHHRAYARCPAWTRGHCSGVSGPLPAFLTKAVSEHGRGWYDKQPQCNEAARTAATSFFGPAEKGVACDEYPFASTVEGGAFHYMQNLVSIRLTGLRESGRHGAFIGRFYGDPDCAIIPLVPTRSSFAVSPSYAPKTDWICSPLRLAADSASSEQTIRLGEHLTAPILTAFAAEALARWFVVAMPASMRVRLEDVRFQMADLPESYLGLASGNLVWIDSDASGRGWYIDPSPGDDSEFDFIADGHDMRATGEMPAAGKVDLLTVIAHELGHVLGLEDLDPSEHPHDMMRAVLETGVRRVPDIHSINKLFADEGRLHEILRGTDSNDWLLIDKRNEKGETPLDIVA